MNQRCITYQGCAGEGKKRIALEGHSLHHVVISHGSLLGDTSSLMMLQVHKVTPWLVKCEPEKLMSLPGLNLTLESCEKCLLFSRKLVEQERCDTSRLLTSQTVLSRRRWTFIIMSWAATKTGGSLGWGGAPGCSDVLPPEMHKRDHSLD